MRLVNETEQEVFYDISYTGSGDCGTIEVDGYVDLPAYDNQSNVTVSFAPSSGNGFFAITLDQSGTGEQVQMVVSAE